MPIVLVQDFSGASLPGGLQADDDTLRGNTEGVREGAPQPASGHTATGDRISPSHVRPPRPLSQTRLGPVAELLIKNHLKSFSIQNRTSAHTREDNSNYRS